MKKKSKTTKPKDIKYGYVVEASPVRAGTVSKLYISEKGPVGLSDLQQAMFFESGTKNACGEDALTQASGYAYWQLGTVKFASKTDGVIRVLESLLDV